MNIKASKIRTVLGATLLAFAALVWISILGLVVFGAVAGLARVLAPWAGDI